MPAPFKWTDEKRREMIAAYESGEGTNSIAKRYHLRHETVASMLQEQGITLRSRHEYARQHTCNHSYFHSLDTEEQAYWLGFLTADGCITTGNRVSVGLGLTDCAHLYKLKTALEATHKVSINNHSCMFVVRSPQIAADLAIHGIVPKKTFATRPAQVAPELARHYWRGVIDGDGYISKDGRQLTLVGDYEVVVGFQAFVLSHCPQVKATIYRKENIYSFHLTGKSAACMREVLYKDAKVYLDRKYERAIQEGGE